MCEKATTDLIVQEKPHNGVFALRVINTPQILFSVIHILYCKVQRLQPTILFRHILTFSKWLRQAACVFGDHGVILSTKFVLLLLLLLPLSTFHFPLSASNRNRIRCLSVSVLSCYLARLSDVSRAAGNETATAKRTKCERVTLFGMATIRSTYQNAVQVGQGMRIDW